MKSFPRFSCLLCVRDRAESGGYNTPQLAAEFWVRGSKSEFMPLRVLICPVVQ